jgi:hypothetical protein
MLAARRIAPQTARTAVIHRGRHRVRKASRFTAKQVREEVQ